MSAATQDIDTPRYGAEDQAIPDLVQANVAASTTIYGGTMFMIVSGSALPAAPAASGAPGLVAGVATRQAQNPYNSSTGAQAFVLGSRGAFWFNVNADSTITASSFGANVYASDDNTVSLSDGGGTRPYAGYLLCIPTTPGIPGLVNGVATTKVAVCVAAANPYAANPEQTVATQFRARAVITTLNAYAGSLSGTLTANANGVLGTQDNVSTLVAGDVVFIPGGTTNLANAADAGPYTINAIGAAGTPYVLQRPDYLEHGSIAPLGATITLGGEGQLFPGTSWRSFAAKGSAVVDANDLKFYPGSVTQSITLANSTAIINNVPIYSATKTLVTAELTSASGTTTNTVGYGTIAAPTPGYLGTATTTIDAIASGMGKNGAVDNSVLNVTIMNWS